MDLVRDLRLLGVLLTSLVLTGCSQLKGLELTPADRARPVDAMGAYQMVLGSKYGAGKAEAGAKIDLERIAARVAAYDSAFERRGAIEEQQRRHYELRLADLQNKLQLSIRAAKEAQDQVQARGDRQYRNLGHVKRLEKRKAALPKELKYAARQTIEEEIDAELLSLEVDIRRFDADMLRLNDAATKAAGQVTQATAALKDGSVFDPSETERLRIRAEIVADFIALADMSYLQFKNELLAGRIQSDLMADIAELMLSTATVLTGGITAKANLGAASTLLKGSRSSIDRNFFAQQSMRAIINGMEDGRQKDRLAIFKKLKTSTLEYPLSLAIADVQQYHSRADLFVAVVDVANQTANSASQSMEKLQEETSAK